MKKIDKILYYAATLLLLFNVIIAFGNSTSGNIAGVVFNMGMALLMADMCDRLGK